MPRLNRDSSNSKDNGHDRDRVIVGSRSRTTRKQSLKDELQAEVVVPEVVLQAASLPTPDHRPNVYVEPLPLDMGGVPDDITGEVGRVVYRMSTLGSCRKALVACRLGIEGDQASEQMQVYYDEGANAEAEILQTVFGGRTGDGGCPGGQWKLLDPEDRQSYRVSRDGTSRYNHCKFESASEAGTGQFTVELPLGQGRIGRGHLDGIAELYASLVDGESSWVNGMRAVVEVKHLATASFDKFVKYGVKALDDFLYYKYQISGYMIGTGLPALYVVAEKLTKGKGDERRYIGIGRITVLWINTPPLSLGKLRSQVGYVEKQAARGELGVCDIEMYPCPVWWLHDGAGDKPRKSETAKGTGAGSSDSTDVTEVPEEWEPDFIRAVSDYTRGMKLEKEAKVLKEGAKEVMMAVVDVVGLDGKGGVLRTSVGDVVWLDEEVEASVVERKAYRKQYPKVGKAWRGEGESDA